MAIDPPDDPDRHPLIGTVVEDDIPQLVDLPPPPGSLDVLPDAELRRYCESCGYVDSHAEGCPRAGLESAMLEAAQEEEEPAPPGDPEPVLPLVRRIGASVLRRVARALDPGRRD